MKMKMKWELVVFGDEKEAEVGGIKFEAKGLMDTS